jgi:Skp family chaperone for outer membrane proteins
MKWSERRAIKEGIKDCEAIIAQNKAQIQRMRRRIKYLNAKLNGDQDYLNREAARALKKLRSRLAGK